MVSTQKTENLAYHASRLLLLISLCGKPRNFNKGLDKLPGIEGRTLLAKLDFFLRYPAYLKLAAAILKVKVSNEEMGLATNEEVNSVESRMVRFLYGPWDHIYYSAIGYLVGKELIAVEKSGKHGTEVFRLTRKGLEVVNKLLDDPTYKDLAERANTTYHLFNRYTGNSLKDFIYINFPEIVGRKIGTMI